MRVAGLECAFRAAAVLTALVAVTTAAPAQQQSVPAAAWKEAWRFEGAQSVFRAPRSLAVSGDCTVWVADPEAGFFRVPCAGGAPEQVRATTGEHRGPWAVARVGGDSVAVFDRNLQRTTIYAASGAAGRSTNTPLQESAVGAVADIAVTAGVLRVWTTQFPTAADPAALPSLILRVNNAGVAHDTLAKLGGLPSIYWGSSFGGSRFAVPHQRRPFVAFLLSGGFVAGSNSHDRVTVHDAQGREVRGLTLALPPALPVSRADRDAYADSVRMVTEQEMQLLRYDARESATFRAQIDTYLKEDVAFPDMRQRYDLLLVDAAESSLWVLLPGTGKNYTRMWEVYALADGALRRRVTVAHRGAVTAAAVRGDALYVTEAVLGARSRVAKYAPGN